MREINLLVAWVAILIGLLTGTALGLFFHDESWLGGYGSWRRRLMRLGHISFFGTGFLNLAFILSVKPPAPGKASGRRVGWVRARSLGHADGLLSVRVARLVPASLFHPGLLALGRGLPISSFEGCSR